MSKDIEQGVAAAPAIANQLAEVDPYLVAFSLNNPRKRRGLDIDSLSALAASIKAQGLAQPILVRPLPGARAADTFAEREDGRPLPTYELVCGERRLRASRIAELPVIPMLVRDLDDDAALELQLVENIEREDLDPLEEAEGFELLRTKLGYSVEQIALRIAKGKGDSYVRKTLKLLDLTPESREAMYQGHLGRSTALLVAHYPADLQESVVAYIKNQAESGEPAPFRKVRPLVYTRFNLDLKKAVWLLTDADLVPAAGACSSCPKRTAADADLFGDDGGADSCKDPDCFAGKREAHVAQVKAQAQKDGIKVIDGEEAKQAFFSPHSQAMQGFTRLTDVAYTQPGDDGKEREVTFEDALRSMGKKAPKPRLIINPYTGAAVKVITDDLADKLTPPENEASEQQTHQDEDDRPPEERALDDYQVRRAVTVRMFDVVRNRDRTNDDMLMIAKTLFSILYCAGDELDLLQGYLSWAFEDLNYDQVVLHIHAKLDAARPEEVACWLTMASAELALNYNSAFTRAQELAIAARYGIDVLAVRDKVAEDLERQDHPGESFVEGAERIAAEAEEQDGPKPADAGELPIATEPPASVGARVRMKDKLRGAGGKVRKISGREGVLLSHVQDDDWMVKCDGSKEKTRVERDEFVVLPAAEDEADPDQVQTPNWPLPVAKRIDPAAAWPFPKAKEAS